MLTLFLDDSLSRVRRAQGEIAGRCVTAMTASEAVGLLQRQPSRYDLISLDHDLTGVFCPSDAESGYAVAQYLAQMPQEQLPKVIICHSWNDDPVRTPPRGGVGNMMDVLSPLTGKGVTVIAAMFDTAAYWAAVEAART